MKLLLAIAALASALIAWALFDPAWSQEDRGTWFKSLKQPGTDVSCCDISDCKRTDATWRKGQWFATDGDGGEVEIPPGRVIDKESIDGEAYVCLSSTKKVYCFVKPSPGA